MNTQTLYKLTKKKKQIFKCHELKMSGYYGEIFTHKNINGKFVMPSY